MTTETISTQVRRTIDALTENRADSPVELLFVGDGSVWLVVDPERIEGEEAMIDVFHAIEAIPGIETIYVERADTAGADRR
jgi:hypothetical protein